MKTKEQYSYHIDTYIISLRENLVLIKDRERKTHQHIPALCVYVSVVFLLFVFRSLFINMTENKSFGMGTNTV